MGANRISIAGLMTIVGVIAQIVQSWSVVLTSVTERQARPSSSWSVSCPW